MRNTFITGEGTEDVRSSSSARSTSVATNEQQSQSLHRGPCLVLQKAIIFQACSVLLALWEINISENMYSPLPFTNDSSHSLSVPSQTCERCSLFASLSSLLSDMTTSTASSSPNTTGELHPSSALSPLSRLTNTVQEVGSPLSMLTSASITCMEVLSAVLARFPPMVLLTTIHLLRCPHHFYRYLGFSPALTQHLDHLLCEAPHADSWPQEMALGLSTWLARGFPRRLSGLSSSFDDTVEGAFSTDLHFTSRFTQRRNPSTTGDGYTSTQSAVTLTFPELFLTHPAERQEQPERRIMRGCAHRWCNVDLPAWVLESSLEYHAIAWSRAQMLRKVWFGWQRRKGMRLLYRLSASYGALPQEEAVPAGELETVRSNSVHVVPSTSDPDGTFQENPSPIFPREASPIAELTRLHEALSASFVTAETTSKNHVKRKKRSHRPPDSPNLPRSSRPALPAATTRDLVLPHGPTVSTSSASLFHLLVEAAPPDTISPRVLYATPSLFEEEKKAQKRRAKLCDALYEVYQQRFRRLVWEQWCNRSSANAAALHQFSLQRMERIRRTVLQRWRHTFISRIHQRREEAEQKLVSEWSLRCQKRNQRSVFLRWRDAAQRIKRVHEIRMKPVFSRWRALSRYRRWVVRADADVSAFHREAAYHYSGLLKDSRSPHAPAPLATFFSKWRNRIRSRYADSYHFQQQRRYVCILVTRKAKECLLARQWRSSRRAIWLQKIWQRWRRQMSRRQHTRQSQSWRNEVLEGAAFQRWRERCQQRETLRSRGSVLQRVADAWRMKRILKSCFARWVVKKRNRNRKKQLRKRKELLCFQRWRKRWIDRRRANQHRWGVAVDFHAAQQQKKTWERWRKKMAARVAHQAALQRKQRRMLAESWSRARQLCQCWFIWKHRERTAARRKRWQQQGEYVRLLNSSKTSRAVGVVAYEPPDIASDGVLPSHAFQRTSRELSLQRRLAFSSLKGRGVARPWPDSHCQAGASNKPNPSYVRPQEAYEVTPREKQWMTFLSTRFSNSRHSDPFGSSPGRGDEIYLVGSVAPSPRGESRIDPCSIDRPISLDRPSPMPIKPESTPRYVQQLDSPFNLPKGRRLEMSV